VNVDATLKTLVGRGYIEESGHDHTPGNPALFSTTRLFLERLGIDSLDELPALADFVPDASIVEALERGLRAPTEADIAAENADEEDGAEAVVELVEVVETVEVVEVVATDVTEA
jgi:segregation and condensation protein B